jgi:hypothetical protein
MNIFCMTCLLIGCVGLHQDEAYPLSRITIRHYGKYLIKLGVCVSI